MIQIKIISKLMPYYYSGNKATRFFIDKFIDLIVRGL